MRNFALIKYIIVCFFLYLKIGNTTGFSSPVFFSEITCGQTIQATTLGQSNDYNYAGQCGDTPIVGGSGEAGDLAYQFILTEAKTVSINLKSIDRHLDMYLVQDNGGIPGVCITQTDLIETNILKNLNIGSYWIIIDGLSEFVEYEGEFELTLNCFPLPSICDLDSRLLIGGNTVYGSTDVSNFELEGFVGTDDFTAGNTPLGHLDFLPCVIEQFSNGLPANYKLYEYYHDGATNFFSVTIESVDSDLRAFVFDCNNTSVEQYCLKATGPGTMTINTDKKGFYNILILSDTNDNFKISLLPASNCIPSTQFTLPLPQNSPFDLPTPTAANMFTLTGKENNFDSRDYQSCYTGTQPYDGGEMVFVHEFKGFRDEVECFRSRDILTLNASSQMSIFVFNDLCNRSCIGSAETGPDGGEIVFFMERDFNVNKNGIYYIVIDQANGETSGDFTLITEVGVACRTDCFYFENANNHKITFSNLTPSFLKEESDKLFVNFQRTDPYINYAPQRINSAPNGSLLDLGNLFQPDLNFGDAKCGYTEKEIITFTALIDGACYVIEPTFNVGPFALNTDTFTTGGNSEIKGLEVGVLCNFPTLEVAPGELSLADSDNKTIETTISSNSSWGIEEKNGDWFSLSQNSGIGKTVIDLIIAPNTTVNPRTGSFKIVASNSNNSIGEEFIIRQPANLTTAVIEPKWAKNIHLYPNPVENLLNIDYEGIFQTALQFQLIDVYGRSVLYQELPINTNFKAIQLNQLTKGIYWARIANKNGVITRKVIVN